MSSPTGSIQKLADIKNKIFDGMYDHMTEKGCSRVTEEVMLDINALIQAARVDALKDLQGWIAHHHTGKGFDGSDRWEMCASEIEMEIEMRLEALTSRQSRRARTLPSRNDIDSQSNG